MHTKKLLIIAAAACLPFAATAGEGKDKTGAHGGANFDTLDANRDGRISQAEAAMDATVVFSSADKNSDGYLDKMEWKNRDKTSTTPQPQSMPDSTSPTSDGTQPEAPPSTEPQPDTEAPRQ
jgi:hypothetical protein